MIALVFGLTKETVSFEFFTWFSEVSINSGLLLVCQLPGRGGSVRFSSFLLRRDCCFFYDRFYDPEMCPMTPDIRVV